MRTTLFLLFFTFFLHIHAKDFFSPAMSDVHSLGELNYTTAYYGGGIIRSGFDGTNYLVLWNKDDILIGNLVSQDGTLLNGKSIRFDMINDTDQYKLYLFSDGKNFIIVYDDYFNLIFQTLNTDENSIQPGDKNVAENFLSRNEHIYSVGFNGKDFLVLHSEYTSNVDTTLVGYRFIDGKEIERAELVYNYDYYSAPPLVFDGENYFSLWWVDYSTYNGGWISSEEGKLSGEKIQNAFKADIESAPDIILFDGTSYLPVYKKYSEDRQTRDLYALKMQKNGDIAGNKAVKIGTLGKSSGYHASFDGEYYNFFLIDINYVPESDCGDHDNYLVWVRINKDGEIASEKCLSSYEFIPELFGISAAYNGNEALLSFNLQSQNKSMYSDPEYLNSIMLDLDKGVVKSKDTVLTKRLNNLIDMDIAFDGTNFMAIWVDDENDAKKIYGAIIDPSGKMLSDEPFLISSGKVDEVEPSIAFNGKEYMVIWRSEDNILGKRFSPDGTSIGSEIGIYSEEKISYPVIASDGQGYLLTWLKAYSNSEKSMLFGIKISEKGALFEKEIKEISDYSSEYRKPEIIFDGEIFFVVWTDVSNSAVLGKRVSANATVLDIDDIVIVRGVPDYPKVFFNGEKFVVFSKSDEYIIVKTVERNGIVNNSVKRITSNVDKGFNVAYDGTNYLITYEEYDESSINYKALVLSKDFEVFPGTIDISEPFEWENNVYQRSQIWTASDKNGQSLVFFRVYSSENSYSTDKRIFFRSVTSSEAGSPCSDESTCRSGFCVNEVCCKVENCDDGNPNTEDTCSDTGECEHEMIYLEPENEGSESSGCNCLFF